MSLNTAQRLAAQRHADQDNRQVAADIVEVLSTQAGRRLFFAMVMQGGVYTHSRVGDNCEYMAGRRDAALEAMQAANTHAPELVLKARHERHETISARNAELKNLEQKA